MQRKEEASLNIMPVMIIIIFAVSIVVIASTLSESGNFGIAQGQGNNITSSSSSIEGNLTLTPEQKSAMCDPNNPLSKLKSVNTTESHTCGIPKTQPSNITTTTTSAAANTTTRTRSEGLPPSEDKGRNCIAFLPCFNAATGGLFHE